MISLLLMAESIEDVRHRLRRRIRAGEHPTGVASRDAKTGEWTILLPPDEEAPFTGVTAPAPLGDLDLYRADLTTSHDWIYLGIAAGLNPGIVAVRTE